MPPGTAVGAAVALHFFEPRYKILIRRAWEGHRLFIYTAGVPRPGSRGVIVRVDQARFLPDGRANILGRGVRQVELDQTWVEDGTGGLFCTDVADVPESPTGRLSSSERSSPERQQQADEEAQRCMSSCALM